MDYFNYPLDVKYLLRKKRHIRKELMESRSEWVEKRIAVLGGSTTSEFIDQIEIALLSHGIKPVFYQSEYGKYYEDAMFGNDILDSFSPDIIYIHTNWRNISIFPEVTDSIENIDSLFHDERKRFLSMWDMLRKKFGCPIIQNNFDRPDYRLLGNRDIWDQHGKSNFVFRLNSTMYNYASTHEDFYINDIEHTAYLVGASEWNAPMYWYLYKYFCGMNAIPYVALNVANIIKAIYGKNKKLMILDLDNTLWGGVVGDDGAESIQIGEETPKGEAFLAFQKYCKELQKKGVLLAIDSKNDECNALAGLENRDCFLKPDDFVSIKANWERKDKNIDDIAGELSLGKDSFVFVDDNPAEREIIRLNIPQVAVPELGNIEDFINIIDYGGYFETVSISKEDMEKTKQYRERKKVLEQSRSFDNYDDFLKSLDMVAEIADFKKEYIPRIAQLTNKSNQFNLTTLRCSEADIQAMQGNPNYICLCARLKDKFGDNGLVTVVAGEIIGNDLHIRLWLMSCRVLKRGLEYEMMNTLINVACKRNIKNVVGYYFPTLKNSMVRYLYKDMGFKLESCEGSKNEIWNIEVSNYKTIDTSIQSTVTII